MLEKMTKILSEEEVDFWSDCADQISIVAEVIKGSPQLSDKEKVEKLNELLDEYGYFTE
jgi:predicted ArsR family transcriptional regulator